MKKQAKTLKSYALDFLVMGTVGALVFSFVMHIAPPVPYTDVKVVGVAQTHGGIIVSATFTEGECAFRSMSVYAEQAGSESAVDWVPIDGSPNQAYDRAQGKAHLVVKIYTFDSYPQTINIWTDHDCKNEQVRKRFATVTLPLKAAT
tara:strand:- start:349 stop:789 length:441 start_codon:yes stop_codon:yes gene_type:complete